MRTTYAFPWLIAVVLNISALIFAAPYGGGSGTPDDPYQIWTAEQMNTIGHNRADLDKSFKLMVDIDLTAYTGMLYNRIGSDGSNYVFNGSFDGNNHIIRNLTFTTNNVMQFVGLFGYTGKNAIIKNLGLININISVAGRYVGGLCGSNSGIISGCYVTGAVTVGNDSQEVGGLCGYNSGTISGCYATGTVSGGNNSSSLGGLCGRNAYGSIIVCFSTGNVTGGDGSSNFGGLCGRDANGSIIGCYSTGNVTGGDGSSNLGGLCGWTYYGRISDCYGRGEVTGHWRVGGLVGYNDGLLVRCYSTGKPTGSLNVGGLCGAGSNASVCFWDVNTSGQTTSDGGTGLTTAAMLNSVTYLRVFWDFVGESLNGVADTWAMPPQPGYPILAWQVPRTLSNDEMSGAISVESNASITGTNVGATGLDLTANGYNDCLDVWYLLEPMQTDNYTIQLRTSDFDATVAVFDSIGREIIFNDDFFGGKSAVILKAKAATKYYIRVAGYDAQSGDFSLLVAPGAIQAIQGDLDYDGQVNLSDFAILAEHWMEGQ